MKASVLSSRHLTKAGVDMLFTLRKSPLPQFQSRIGEKAIEMVCGFIHHTSIDDERAPITLGSGLGSCCYTF